jgi:phage/plasmid primase-like uncharacterized protein
MRVASDMPAKNGGWIHNATGASPLPRAAPASGYEPPDFDADRWWQAVRRVITWDKMESWATRLGLPIETLDIMGGCHLGTMLAFPMYDGTGEICGIRTRNRDGTKRSVTGSRAGVFLPAYHDPEAKPVICEGPTDAAAALALGFYPIGRPSCSGCERHVVDTCRRLGIKKVTLCADDDGPGIAGARRLGDVLQAAKIAVRLVTPCGHKDLRDWLKAGATRDMVDAQWSQAKWRDA